MFVKHRERGMGYLGAITPGQHSVVERLREVRRRYGRMSSIPRDFTEARSIESEMTAIASAAPNLLPFAQWPSVVTAINEAVSRAVQYREESNAFTGFGTMKDRMRNRIKNIIELITGVSEPEADPAPAATIPGVPATPVIPAVSPVEPAPVSPTTPKDILTPAKLPILPIAFGAIAVVGVVYYFYTRR